MGGLKAAKELNLKTGGTAAKMYMTSKGPNYTLRDEYGLNEIDTSKWRNQSLFVAYIERSKINVDNSDGTIAFRTKKSSGTEKTIGYCINKQWKEPLELTNRGEIDKSVISFTDMKTKYKPLLLVENFDKYSDDEIIAQWIIDNDIKVLNVCGHRDDELEVLVKECLIKSLDKYL